jgi:hypothetical protein
MSELLQLRHEINEFAQYTQMVAESRQSKTSKMLYQPEKLSPLSKIKEKAFSGAFFGLALLAMAGWVYLLSSIFLKFVVWCFYYFAQ